MEKPKRSDEKYWTGTNQFDEIQYANDLEEYITALEAKLTAPTDDSIYGLKLHEGISVVSLGKNNGIFIPFNNEFLEKVKPTRRHKITAKQFFIEQYQEGKCGDIIDVRTEPNLNNAFYLNIFRLMEDYNYLIEEIEKAQNKREDNINN